MKLWGIFRFPVGSGVSLISLNGPFLGFMALKLTGRGL